MNSFSFGQLVLSPTAPSTSTRAAIVRNNLRDHRYEAGYLEVQAVEVPSPSTFYALVTFRKAQQTMKTFVCGFLRSQKKEDGYWLNADCYVAAGTMPPGLSTPSQTLLDAWEALKVPQVIDEAWLDRSIEHAEHAERKKLMTKGSVFVSQDGSGPILGGYPATHVVIVSKARAMFIAPLSGLAQELSTEEVSSSFTLLPAGRIPALSRVDEHTEVGELVFEISEGAAKLKGRLLKGVKAKIAERNRLQRQRLITQAQESMDISSLFASGAWLA